MILVCICDIVVATYSGEKPVHEYGHMLNLPDRSKENIGFNTDYWRMASDFEVQIYNNGTRNVLTAFEKFGL